MDGAVSIGSAALMCGFARRHSFVQFLSNNITRPWRQPRAEPKQRARILSERALENKKTRLLRGRRAGGGGRARGRRGAIGLVAGAAIGLHRLEGGGEAGLVGGGHRGLGVAT